MADAVVVLALKMVVSRGIFVALPIYLEQDLSQGKEAIAYLLVPGIAGLLVGPGGVSLFT